MANPPPLPPESERNHSVPSLPIPGGGGTTSRPRSTRASSTSKLIIARVVAFGAFFGFRVVQTIQHFRTHPLKHAPGYEELLQAKTLVTTSGRGLAHGNSPEAVELAAKMSATLKEVREQRFSAGNKDSLDMQAI